MTKCDGFFERDELRQVFGDRIFDREFAFVPQHHDGGGCDRLRHRRHPKQTVGSHGSACRNVRLAHRINTEDLVVAGDKRDGTGNFLLPGQIPHRSPNAGKGRWRLGASRESDKKEAD
jgi:hypothetical protein